MKRALAGAAALLVFGACTGSSGLTKAQYAKRANAICRDAAKQVAALQVPADSDVDELPQAAADVVAVQRETLERLRDIKPPKADRSRVTQWIALVDQTIDQAEVSAAAQRDGDIPRAMTANTNGAALDRRADQLAKAYGLQMCVQAATAPTTTTTSAPPATSEG